jgi:3alpha(or 20beta)-hydroxysteroid dehydrogenase
VTQRFVGKTALVSGGARGSGASHSRRFVAEGGKVVIGDLLVDEGQALASALGDAARFVHLDVTDEGSWRAARQEAEAAFGPISILVNNAGIHQLGGILDTSLSDFNDVVSVNLNGTCVGTKTIAPSLIEAGGGSIIYVSSIAGMIGLLDIASYVAATWAIRGLTKASAFELGQFNIRVDSIHPGRIATNLPANLNGAIRDNQLIKEPGRLEDVSNLVAFLASDESRFSTGVEFIVDGGRYLGESDPVV